MNHMAGRCDQFGNHNVRQNKSGLKDLFLCLLFYFQLFKSKSISSLFILLLATRAAKLCVHDQTPTHHKEVRVTLINVNS